MSKWAMRTYLRHLCFNSFSNNIKNSSRRWVLTPTIALWRFGSPFGTPTPNMGVWGFIPSHSLHSREHVKWLLRRRTEHSGPGPPNPWCPPPRSWVLWGECAFSRCSGSRKNALSTCLRTWTRRPSWAGGSLPLSLGGYPPGGPGPPRGFPWLVRPLGPFVVGPPPRWFFVGGSWPWLPSISFFPWQFWCYIGVPSPRPLLARMAIPSPSLAWPGCRSMRPAELFCSLLHSREWCRSKRRVWRGRSDVPRWSALGGSGRRSSELRALPLSFHP